MGVVVRLHCDIRGCDERSAEFAAHSIDKYEWHDYPDSAVDAEHGGWRVSAGEPVRCPQHEKKRCEDMERDREQWERDQYERLRAKFDA